MMPRAEQAAAALLRYVLLPFAAAHTDYSFVVFATNRNFETANDASHISVLSLQPPKRRFLRSLWFQFFFFWKQRSVKPDLILQAAGHTWLYSAVPQISFLQDYRNGTAVVEKSWQQMMKNAAKRCTHHLLFDDVIASQLKEYTFASADPISVPSLGFLLPEKWGTDADHIETKQVYTAGFEYLLCADAGDLDADEMKMLLKAYAQFKKKQHTGMKLVLLGADQQNNSLAEEINSYRYRQDLIFLNTQDRLLENKLVAAAYALVDVGFSGHLRFHLLKALASEVPVIAPRLRVLQAFSDAAFVFYDDRNMADLAMKMMLLYKDEAFRSQCIRSIQTLRKSADAPSLFSALDRLFCRAAKRV